MSKIVLVGQAPMEDPSGLISGRSVEKLALLCGIAAASLGDHFEVRSCVENFNDGKFDMRAAKKRVNEVLVPGLANRMVLLLGKKVARAFGYTDPVPFLIADDKRGFKFAYLPHPSPINLYWNKPENVEQAKAFFSGLLAPEDEAVE